MRNYQVQHGELSEVVTATSADEAWAAFADRYGATNPDVQRFPKRRVVVALDEPQTTGESK